MIIRTGDHSFGMIQGIGFIFFGLNFCALFCFALGRSFYRMQKKQDTFSWYSVIIFTIISTIIILGLNAEYGKFWTSVYLRGSTDYKQYSKDGNLVLFKNGTFRLSENHVDFGSAFEGNFTIEKNDILLLHRTSLPEKTDSIFYNRYKIYLSKNRIVPLSKGFPEIIIE